jgi:hypothetical protein
MYIPSKYNFRVSSSLEDSYKLEEIDMTTSDNVADDYGDDTEATLEKVVLLPSKNEKMEKHLENNYKDEITLKDISDQDTIILKSVYRQLKRLSYSVKNIDYKLGIIVKNYLCVIRRDDSINCFYIKKYPRDTQKKLKIILDLELFYEKNDSILEDIYTVRNSIYTILEKNQGNHTNLITKILEDKKQLLSIPTQIEIKNKEYDAMISKLEGILLHTLEKEESLTEQLKELVKPSASLQNDISRAHTRSRLEAEMDKVLKTKTEITKTMVDIRTKKEDMILTIDKLLFDNTIMFDAIAKNFKKLKDFCK